MNDPVAKDWSVPKGTYTSNNDDEEKDEEKKKENEDPLRSIRILIPSLFLIK